jgi:hypothetical protein
MRAAPLPRHTQRGFPRLRVGLAWEPLRHPSPQRKQGNAGGAIPPRLRLRGGLYGNRIEARSASKGMRAAPLPRTTQRGFPRLRVGLAWEPLRHPSPQRKQGNADGASPTDHATRIPSLARRACMGTSLPPTSFTPRRHSSRRAACRLPRLPASASRAAPHRHPPSP